MSTTASQATAALRALFEANTPSGLTLRWPNEDHASLPDTPAAFAHTEFWIDRASPRHGVTAFGGGRGRNLYRNTAQMIVFIFVPRGQGLAAATDLAESVAQIFRSHRDSTVSCFGATVIPGASGAAIKPPGLDSEVENYFYAVCEVNFSFDLIG
jgi:hypothetical protein